MSGEAGRCSRGIPVLFGSGEDGGRTARRNGLARDPGGLQGGGSGAVVMLERQAQDAGLITVPGQGVIDAVGEGKGLPGQQDQQ